MAQRNRFKQLKALKKELSKELMFVTWYHKRWFNQYVPEDKKKEEELFLLMKSRMKLLVLYGTIKTWGQSR